MNRRQLIALFVCMLVPYTAGSALLPLLPVYARQLGVDAGVTGIYLAASFGALTAGTLASGWISRHFQRRRLMIVISGVVSFPAIIFMGQAVDIAQLTLATMVVWFMGGLSMGTVNILTGHSADPARRGRTFGIIGMTVGLGNIIGGLSAGPIVDQWGYETLFNVVSFTQFFSIVVPLFIADERVVHRSQDLQTPRQSTMTQVLWLLLVANTLAYSINFAGQLGRPLLMATLSFDATAISSTAAATGFIILPLPFVLGWLSDRVGRRPMLVLCYVSVCIGTIGLVVSSLLWHFWLTSILTVIVSSSIPLGSALIGDILPKQNQDVALARFSSTAWAGGVLGFGATGFIMQAVGLQTTFLIAAIIPLISILMLFAINRQPRSAQANTGT